MDAAPSPPSAAPTAPAPTTVLIAWTQPAQLVMAFLLGVAITLAALSWYGSLRWGTRPTLRERQLGSGYRIDLNRAEPAELLQLPGVGENLARRIEAYRRDQGGFRRVDDLVKVHGIGPATLQRLRPWVCVQQKEAAEENLPAIVRERRPFSRDSASRQRPGKKAANLKRPININEAPAAELQRLPGIGPVLAQRILAERGQRPFQSADDLRHVHGIGPKKLQALRPYVVVESAPLRVAARKPD